MTWIIANWKSVIAFGLAGVLFISGWYLGSEHVQNQWNEEKLTVQDDALGVMNTHALMIKEADEQHDKDQTTLDTARTELNRLQHPNLPKCPSTGSQDVSAGILYAEQNAAFKELQRGDDEDFAKCDQLNIDAIRLNTECTTNQATLPRQPLKEAGSWLQ